MNRQKFKIDKKYAEDILKSIRKRRISFKTYDNLYKAVLKEGIRYGTYNFKLTEEDIRNLKAGKVLAYGDEYMNFVYLEEGEEDI